jgi:hypothetical protein
VRRPGSLLDYWPRAPKLKEERILTEQYLLSYSIVIRGSTDTLGKAAILEHMIYKISNNQEGVALIYDASTLAFKKAQFRRPVMVIFFG